MTRTDLNVERVRHELKARVLTVAHVERIAGLLARVTFTGDDLHDFVSASFDDHVKLFFSPRPFAAAGPAQLRPGRHHVPRRRAPSSRARLHPAPF